MTPDAWITISVLVLVVAGLATNRVGIDVVMAGGLTLLLLTGVIDIGQAASGFGSAAVLMLGGLFIVAKGLEHTGAIRMAASKLLGKPQSVRAAQFRLMAPVALFSGFMNNTPIVAIGIPIVRDWARRLGISPSALFIPLSFAAILGAKLTVIGSASNLIVMEEFLSWAKNADPTAAELGSGWAFFGVAAIGLPMCIVGIAFIGLFAGRLLPERRTAENFSEDGRKYRTQLVVSDDAPFIGKTIEEAELRNLPGLFLSEIERITAAAVREESVQPKDWDNAVGRGYGVGRVEQRVAVSPYEKLRGGDVLTFVGALDTVMDLRNMRGLEVADEQTEKMDTSATQRRMVECVISMSSPLVGRSIRNARFRTRYNAVVIAVHRQGQQVAGKIGDITLRPGDTLLLESHQNFVQTWRGSDEFYLVSELDGERPVRHNLALIALAILAAMVLLLATGWVDRVAAIWTAAMAMIVTRCLSGTEARRAVNWQILVVVASSLGIAAAVESTGLASRAVELIEPGMPVTAVLLVIFLLAAGVSQLVTPFAAAVLMFPFTMQLATSSGGDPLTFMFTLMVAVGCPFINPVGYQTNLMVFGPGGYRFSDFARLGLPLTLVLAVLTAVLAPLVYA